jgi:hypothetical protein
MRNREESRLRLETPAEGDLSSVGLSQRYDVSKMTMASRENVTGKKNPEKLLLICN